MASEVKTNKVSPAVGADVILGDSSDTFTVPSGVTLDVNGEIDITGATATGFPSSGFIKYTPVLISIDPFALQPDTTKLIIEVQSSGGYAGNSDAGGYAGGSGGGGAYARKLLDPMVYTDTLDINIGAVAAIGATGTTTSVASAGGTSFTAITCDGGNGGVTASGAYGLGGVGGTLPTTGDFNIAGGNGGKGNSAIGAQGGAWMARANHWTDNVVGVMSVGYGGGGSSMAQPSTSGAAGSPAVVIIWEYK